jgi:excisionase family DNA binding protein
MLKSDPLLTVAEVSALLSVSRGTAWNLVRNREIPSIKIRRCVRVRRSDVERYLEENRQ